MIRQILVDWMDGYGNDPRIEIVDPDYPNGPKWPGISYPIWSMKDGFHLTFDGDYALYFYTDGKPTEGYGGRPFEGTFTDGSTFKYRGAWSSRASCINAKFPESRIVDVTCGYRTCGYRAEALIKHFRYYRESYDFGLAWVDCRDHAPILMPCGLDGTLKNPDRCTVIELI